MTRPLLIGSAAALATLLATPNFAVAQDTYGNSSQPQMNSDQSSGQVTKRKHANQAQISTDQQSGDVSKKKRTQATSDQQSTGAIPQTRKQALARDVDRDRHGDRSRSRHGQFRYFHEGYYYATPWWTVGVPGVVVGNGGFDCGDGIRVVHRRGFDRVRPIDCGGEFFRYEGWRGGEPWRIRMDADTGQIVSIRPAG